MPILPPKFPGSIWDGSSRTRKATALESVLEIEASPDAEDWKQIVAEVISLESHTADTSSVVHLTGAETITGAKTFTVPAKGPLLDQGGAVFNVKGYGALGNGTADDTTAIQAAITAASAVGGGVVFFPPGTYLSGTITIASFIHIRGSGVGATQVKLKSGTNGDLIQSAGAASLISIQGIYGTGNSGGAVNWSIRDITLDGNKAGNTAGWVVRVYGYGWRVDGVILRNGASGGMQSDWNGGSSSGNDSMECYLTNFKAHDNAGAGLEFGGPHDSIMLGGVLWGNAPNIHIGPNAVAMLFTNLHCWSPVSGQYNIITEGGYTFWSGCEAEGVGSNLPNLLVLHGDTTWVGGHLFGTHGNQSAAATGVQFGQTATTTYGSGNGAVTVTGAISVSGCSFDTKISNCEGTGGAIACINENGNRIRAVIFQQAGTGVTGTVGNHTDLALNVNGLTADGTIALGGGTKVAATSTAALNVTDAAGASYFQVDTFSATKAVSLQNNPKLTIYTAGGSTVGTIINHDGAGGIQMGNTNVITLRNRGGALIGLNGTFTLGQSTAAQTVATGGTITTTQGTSPNIVTLGVARVTTAGAVTGVILQAGSASGHVLVVINESANSLTMAAASSNVANAATCVIAATMAKTFVWDSVTSLWYPTS